jgi:hypothetical protein
MLLKIETGTSDRNRRGSEKLSLIVTRIKKGLVKTWIVLQYQPIIAKPPQIQQVAIFTAKPLS